jgi:hypothetical protein
MKKGSKTTKRFSSCREERNQKPQEGGNVMLSGKLTSGLFLSLEGIDFTWKTPFVEWLKRDFSDNREVVITRDPPLFSPSLE